MHSPPFGPSLRFRPVAQCGIRGIDLLHSKIGKILKLGREGRDLVGMVELRELAIRIGDVRLRRGFRDTENLVRLELPTSLAPHGRSPGLRGPAVSPRPGRSAVKKLNVPRRRPPHFSKAVRSHGPDEAFVLERGEHARGAAEPDVEPLHHRTDVARMAFDDESQRLLEELVVDVVG